MTDHIWAQEHIAAHLAGGLSSEERDRLDRHAKECPECAEMLVSAVHFDRGLGTLFAPLRPRPGLEDRAILAVRVAPKPHAIFFIGWPRRVTAVAAAIIALTACGALAASLMEDGQLPLPGSLGSKETAKYASATISPSVTNESARRSGAESPKELSNEDPGLESTLDALAKKTLDDIVTNDVIGGYATASSAHGQPNDSRFKEGITDQIKVWSASSNGTSNGQPMPPPLPGRGYATYGNAPPKPGEQPFSLYMGYEGYSVPVRPGISDPPAPVVVTTGVPMQVTGGTTYFSPSKESERALKELGTLLGRPEGKATEPGKRDGKDGPKDQQKSDPKSTGEPKPGSSAPPVVADPVPEPTRRVVLRSGDIEFEVESFDSALATVTKLVTGIKGAFVGTVNSDKLPNGKVRGSIVVRTPPEFLDSLVLDLRKELGKGGELKSVKLASQDVTKQYTDTESRLRAWRAMETRLLAIIKDGKGEIKQLVEAERELGVWRTKIEEAEGELRYFANLAALSTLTITLVEKEIRTAVGVTENERVQAGVEVEDVDKSYQSLMKDVVEAKGRVTKSEVRLLAAGQYDATLNFEVSPEASGPVRDRLRQLGRVARLEIDRTQQADGAVVPKDAKVKRGDTQFFVKLYNLANIAPRETATISVAAPDVANAYNAIRDALAKASARVRNAQLNETDKNNITAQLDFDIKRTDEGAIRTALAAAGESISRQVVRAPESDNVTDTKIAYKLSLSAASRLRPRDAITLQIAVSDVPAAFNALRAAAAAGKGRVFTSQLNENDKQNVNASLDFDVQRTDEAAVKAALESAGETVSRQIARAAENEAATDSKIFYSVKLLPANGLKPRETTVLGLEVPDVDQAVAVFISQFNEVKGRQIDAKSGRERNGRSTAKLIYEVPLASASGLVERFKSAGTVRALTTSRDAQAPEGKSATARIEITLANPESIVQTEDGLWAPVKKGLTHSASFLLASMTWLVFGLCVILPWALVGYGGYRVVKRVMRPSEVEVPSAPAPQPPAAT